MAEIVQFGEWTDYFCNKNKVIMKLQLIFTENKSLMMYISPINNWREDTMVSSSFNVSANVDKTRAAMGQRLGEIIETVIGDARVRELFDRAGTHPAEYEGKPTGLMALDLKVITPETKTALLVAQAAERAYTLAEKSGVLAAQGKTMIAQEQKVDTADAVPHDDPVFKFVGSDRDPAILRQAQGTWMAAQLLLNNEIESINGPIANPGYVAHPSSQGVEAAQGFKAAAVALYAKASELLHAEGHDAAADSLKQVATALAAVAAPANGPTPAETMRALANDFTKGSQNLVIMLGDERYAGVQTIVDAYDRLFALVIPGNPADTIRNGTAPGPR